MTGTLPESRTIQVLPSPANKFEAMAAGNDLFKLYRYDPSLAAAIIFIILFLLITAWHSFTLLRTKTWFFIPFVLGGFCQ